jgi:NAD(P)-dependent dehydrogenase (short-subunit alcohol dehydrogenase family)
VLFRPGLDASFSFAWISIQGYKHTQTWNAMTRRFCNKQALVTGGTSGIGKAVVVSLLEAGCNVIATGVSPKEVNDSNVVHKRVSARALDVCDEVSIQGLASDLKRLDLLINCAGTILRRGREFDPVNFAKVIDVNLQGTMRMCSAFQPLLFQSRGCVVNVASLYSVFGAKHAPAYSASKGGIVQLTKSLAVAWAEAGVRVNAVMPGWIDTPFTQAVRQDAKRNRAILERTPMQRWGTAQEVANAVLFLCSENASFITGAVLPVDGGYSAA